MPYDREFIPDETVFLMSGQKMLSDVLRALEDQLNGTPLRDARSAFRFLTERAGVDLTTTVATTKTLRSVFEALHPASLGVIEKRFANIRSILIRAVEEYGQPRIWLTRDFDMAPEWESLLARIPREDDRCRLSPSEFAEIRFLGPEMHDRKLPACIKTLVNVDF
ncbi:MAG: hypothetical protein AAGB07_01100 [Pseudomonadota bacterium]